MITLETATTVSLVLTIVGFVAGCIRLILGPSRADRVVSLDLLTVLLVAISALLAVAFDQPAYLDAGLAIALVGFLATVAFARYIESEPASDTPASRTAIAAEGQAGSRSAQPSSDSASRELNQEGRN